jgi:hypothetical protein
MPALPPLPPLPAAPPAPAPPLPAEPAKPAAAPEPPLPPRAATPAVPAVPLPPAPGGVGSSSPPQAYSASGSSPSVSPRNHMQASVASLGGACNAFGSTHQPASARRAFAAGSSSGCRAVFGRHDVSEAEIRHRIKCQSRHGNAASNPSYRILVSCSRSPPGGVGKQNLSMGPTGIELRATSLYVRKAAEVRRYDAASSRGELFAGKTRRFPTSSQCGFGARLSDTLGVCLALAALLHGICDPPARGGAIRAARSPL